MLRKIVDIDQDKCNGCGACASACHEGAIIMIDGKAKLARDDYCDGLGDCLPACPTGAISIIEREADAYDESAVAANKKISNQEETLPCGCPGTQSKTIEHQESGKETSTNKQAVSRLQQWPVQIKLVPTNAPYFHASDLLVAADCTAFAYGAFHEDFIANHVTLIGCPKLDNVDYSEKLSEIIKSNDIKSITIARMEVPCCGGLENATRKALQQSGKSLPINVVTISCNGNIVNESEVEER